MTKARYLGEKFVDYCKEYRNLILYAFIFCSLVYLICFLFTLILVIGYFFVNIYLLCDALLYSPNYPPESRKAVETPEKYNFKDYECNFFQSSDNVSLHYIFLRKEKIEDRSKVPTIVYLHGNAGNIGHRLENALEMFRILNVNVLMPEYRGYGFSKGKPSENGLCLDGIASLEFLYNRSDIHFGKVILFGRSLGGAVTIGAIHKILKTPRLHHLVPAALILENTFTSVPDVAQKMSNEQMNPIISRLIWLLPGWFYRSRYDSRRKIKQIDIPMLFISGLKDELLPAYMMEDLFNTAKTSAKRIDHFPNGTHNFTWKCTNYYATLDNFLVQIIKGELITNTIRNANSVSIPISDLERSPLILNEEIEWRTLCNTEAL